MIRALAALLLMGSAALAAPASTPAPTPVSPRSYQAYILLTRRNIFDPDRRPYVLNAPTPAYTPRRTVVTAPPPRPTDYLALTGVMMTDGKEVAFFAGSRSDYNKVIPVNGEIANARVVKITTSGIDVSVSGKTITVNIGQTVPLDGSSTPGVPPAGANFEPSQSSDGYAPGGGGTSAAPTPLPAALDAIRQRMMQRRSQQTK